MASFEAMRRKVRQARKLAADNQAILDGRMSTGGHIRLTVDERRELVARFTAKADRVAQEILDAEALRRRAGSLREAVRLVVAEAGDEGISADRIAAQVACSDSTARNHAVALAEAGELHAYKRRRYDSQADHWGQGLFGGAGVCKRRVMTFYAVDEHRPAGVHGSY